MPKPVPRIDTSDEYMFDNGGGQVTARCSFLGGDMINIGGVQVSSVCRISGGVCPRISRLLEVSNRRVLSCGGLNEDGCGQVNGS